MSSIDSDRDELTGAQERVDVSADSPRRTPTPAPHAATRRLDVLLVDDDPVVRKNYAAELRAEAWEVAVAADGDEALRAAWETRFDVVLLDLRLPVHSGPEVLRALRTRPQAKDTAVYLLAQSGDAALVEAAMKEGAQGVFEKSRVTPRDVVHEIAASFAGRPYTPRATPPAARGTPQIEDTRVEERGRAPATSAGAPRLWTIADSVVVATRRRTPAGGAPPGAYRTMIARSVGDSAKLAAALGLSTDFGCTRCKAPMALQLAPDPTASAGVRGRFVCTHCES